ncbi:MAG: OB-fold domain-containing protein [Streptosporangiaceae bacterium]|nr:OB-fold domain-containing protein [Streptosporangiaceae bacterium]MBV9855418.1 OB-fold domain-containing protein [Streptosporangiaceae bacterium]
MRGVTSYGAYIPYYRLERGRIAGVLGSGGGRGTRSVAAYDEDTTSLAVAAGRAALTGLTGTGGQPGRETIRQLFFATTVPAYADKTNATAVHAALRLPAGALAVDMAGAVRSGVGALVTAAQSPVPAMAVLTDIRTGLPGSADERDGGDGAAAFIFGGDGEDGEDRTPVLAEIIGQGSATAEFLDRWRAPGAPASRVWEERFGAQAYGPLAEAAMADALKGAGLTPGQVDHLIVAGLPARAVSRAVRAPGVPAGAVVDNLAASIGNAGAAQPGILLADVLDRAGPDETILLVVLADGAAALALRTTAALAAHRQPRQVAAQIAAGNGALEYATFLSWRGFLDREPPRRPDPDPVAAPPAQRRADWKFGLVAAKCTRCGTRSLPPGRVCEQCHAVDEMAPEPLAGVPATVRTYTVDRLAYTPSPPMLMAVLDFDGGGRMRCQLTDAAEDEVRVGLRVEMTFRRLVTAAGVHNYFWKARPVRGEDGTDE